MKPYDILPSSPHTHPFRPELDCLTTLHSFSSRFSCSFWLKEEFYPLLVESMLIRAKVNFCNSMLAFTIISFTISSFFYDSLDRSLERQRIDYVFFHE